MLMELLNEGPTCNLNDVNIFTFFTQSSFFILLPCNFSWNVIFIYGYTLTDMHFILIFVDKTMKTSFIDLCNVIRMVAHQVQ